MSLDLQKTPVIRSLGPDEREALHSVPGTQSDEPPAKPEHSIVICAEVDDQIVASIQAEKAWMVSGLRVHPEFRGTGLAERIARELATYNVDGFSEFVATRNPHVELIVFRWGFIPVAGTLFRR